MKRLVIFTLVLLSSCGGITVKKDFVKLKQKAQCQTGHEVNWHDIDKKEIPTPNIAAEVLAGGCAPGEQTSFSRQQAIGYALEHNIELQAHFEDLGIAKADLKQAGLFTNPQVHLLFKFPTFSLLPVEKPFVNRHTKIDFESTMQISDFWKVPVRKKIAYDDLEIMTFTIMHLIIEIATRTKLAYDTCLYAQARLCLLEQIYGRISEMRNRINYRQGFGFESDLDRYLIDMKVGKWQSMIIEQKAQLRSAFADLRTVMGLHISTQSILLADCLDYAQNPVASVECLEKLGLEYRAGLQIAQLSIIKSEHELSLQKRKVFDDVRLGVSFERDFVQAKGVGGAFGMSLPIFDQNYAQITRARFMIKKAKKTYKLEKRIMLDQIYHGHEQLEGLAQEVDVYKQSIMPASQKAIAYSEKYLKTMQQNILILLETHIANFEVQEALLNKNYAMAHAYAHLEKSIGKILA